MWRLCTKKIHTVHQTIWESDLWPAEWPFSLFFFFFFSKSEEKNWFADWLIELAFYRKNIRIFLSFFSHFFLPTSPTLLISPLVICYVLFHDARFPGWFIFLESNDRPLCKLLQVQQKIKGLFTWRRGGPQVGEVTGLGVVTRLSI